MELIPIQTSRLEGKIDLAHFFLSAMEREKIKLKNGDLLVVSSKLVAVSEGNVVDISTIVPSAAAKKRNISRYGTGKEDPRIVELVLREAEKVIPGNMMIALKDGNLMPAAGIDLSNAPDGIAILLPKNSWQSAWKLRATLLKKLKLKKLGVAIIDSRCQPLRWGTVGIALGWAGFDGIEDVRGQKDLYGKSLKVTRKAVADNLASAAQLVMGEGDEARPFVIARDAPAKFTNKKPDPKKIRIAPSECIFEGVYNKHVL